MANKRRHDIVYSEDIAGFWLYLKHVDGYELLNDRPIVDPRKKEMFKQFFKDGRNELQLWYREDIDANIR